MLSYIKGLRRPWIKIGKATKIILPGVGSFDAGMKNLKELNLIPILNKMFFI